MKVIKKVVMYVAMDEKDIKEWATDDVMPTDKTEREEWLKYNAESLLDFDLDGMLNENQRQYGVSWKIRDPYGIDFDSDEYKEVSEDC